MNSYIAGNYKTLSNTISQVVPAVILENTNFEDLFSANNVSLSNPITNVDLNC